MIWLSLPGASRRVGFTVRWWHSPAAEEIAKAFDARPCARPARAGLGLLAGDDEIVVYALPR